MNDNLNSVENFVIDEIKTRLDNLEGEIVYGCDLAHSLFWDCLADCTFTYSTYGAIEWIKDNFEEIGEVLDDISEYITANTFSQPELFQVQLLYETAFHLLSQCETVDSFWDREQELSEEIIEKISDELDCIS